MAEEEREHHDHGAGKGGLSKKVGPFPLWVWVVGGTALAYFGYRWYKNRGTTGTTATAATATASGSAVGAGNAALLASISDLYGQESTETGGTSGTGTGTGGGGGGTGGGGGGTGGGGGGGKPPGPKPPIPFPPYKPPHQKKPIPFPPYKPPGPKPKPPGPKPKPKPGPKPRYVTVVRWTPRNPWRSTMSGIAAHERISLAELLKLNPQVKNPNIIHAGQKIRVPAKP